MVSSLFFVLKKEGVGMTALYSYDGPVLAFDKIVANRWRGTTRASSAEKARNNLAYQFKRNYHLMPNTKITLPAQMVMKT